ncbi:NACHT domain-containing protein [Trichothermofontia sp.]
MTSGNSDLASSALRQHLLALLRQELDDRLSYTLHHGVWREAIRGSVPELPARLWDIEVKLRQSPRFPLTPEMGVLGVLAQTDGKLMVLGGAGTGKTSTLIDLAHQLWTIAQTSMTAPLPLYLSLVGWRVSVAIAPWLVEQLQQRYQIPPDIGQSWLQQRQIIPLLDDLDRLPLAHQEPCLQSLSQFLDTYPRLVLATSLEAYTRCQTRLTLNGGMLLRSLTNDQIDAYLKQTESLELHRSLGADPTLLGLAKNALLLNMMILATDEILIRAWRGLTTFDDRRHYLISAYVRNRLHRNTRDPWYHHNREPLSEQTKHWLHWLAHYLQTQQLADFRIEDLQPSILASSQSRWAYAIGVGLLEGIILGGSFGLLSRQVPLFLLGLAIGLASIPLHLWQQGPLQLQLQPQAPIFNLLSRHWVSRTSLITLAIVLVSAIVGGLLQPLSQGTPNSFLAGLTLLLSLGLICFTPLSLKALTQRWQPIPLSPPLTAVQAMQNASLLACLGMVISSGIWFYMGLPPAQFAVLSPCLGLLLGLAGGGEAAIQHGVLRFLLWGQGYIPWNYRRFLNYVSDRLLLQRHQHRYQFVHGLLQSYFSQIR